MKPAIYYTLRESIYKSSFEILAVTTERGRRVYGRSIPHGDVTNAATRQCYGRFGSEQQAREMKGTLEHIHKIYSDRIRELDASRLEARRVRMAAINSAIEGAKA